ncbi:MAG: hypothetical protein ACYC56_10550 [Candidatus Aquicultor sp.]
MKFLGIWHPDRSEEFAKKLLAQGFNTYMIAPNWELVVSENPKDTPYEELQELTAIEMRERYDKLKKMGFKFFLNFGSGWGLGEFDKNWFFRKIYEQFEDCDDMLFDLGEFYEDYVETGKMKEEEYTGIVAEKREFFGKKLELGNTARNKIKLGSDTLTSYWNQEKYWRNTDPFVWIFGQAGWHNISSLRYKSKAEWCKKNNIQVALLYQGDKSEWKAIGWENKIADILHIRNWFENWQRKRFIKIFQL